jgi:hypothetical protein
MKGIIKQKEKKGFMEQTITENKQLAIPVRNSGVELLKIIGILLVVVSHVVQTLGTDWSSTLGFNDYYINTGNATRSMVTLIIIILRYSGALGNTIFFTCSAWYLINSNETNTKKIWRMVCDIFVISILWLIPMLFVYRADLGIKNIINSIFPTFFSNNWYLTTYIIFGFIYPFINKIIENISQKTHITIASVLFLAYLCINTVYSFPCTSDLLIWISIYFVISYFKKYGTRFCDSTKANVKVLLIGILGNLARILLTNFLGLKIGFFSYRLQHWAKNCNVFFAMTAFSSLNLFRKMSFKSKAINYISSLSLLIYIIHENILFRTFVRPQIWQWIYLNLGYDLILVWILVFVLALFIASAIIASLYKVSLQKLVKIVADKIYSLLTKICTWCQIILIKIIK